MIYAQNTGLIDAVPSINIGKAFEKPQKKNMPSIRPNQLLQLMQTMRIASWTAPLGYQLVNFFCTSFQLRKKMVRFSKY